MQQANFGIALYFSIYQLPICSFTMRSGSFTLCILPVGIVPYKPAKPKRPGNRMSTGCKRISNTELTPRYQNKLLS